MQKRSLTLLLLLLFAFNLCSAADGNRIGIRFERTGTAVSDVKVRVVDTNGQTIEGATATLASSHSLKNAGAAVNAALICPDVNANTSPTIQLTVTVQGLPSSLTFDKMGLDIHALNGGGAYQANNDGKNRRFNVAVECGSTADALSSFATLTNIDIAAGVGESGSVHKYWGLNSGTAKTAEGSLVITLTITKGDDNQGCFFGLSAITVGDTGEITETEPEEPGDDTVPRADANYYITWFSNAGQYITETAAGALVVTGENVTERQFWEFVPTGEDHCYYIRNTATGHYIQSCNLPASSASKIKVGNTPVAYYVERNTKDGAAVKGYFRLTSTDCPNYANTDLTPLGLNKDGASSSVIAYHAGHTNNGSYWMLTETDKCYELRPFTPSPAIGKANYTYALTRADGRVLAMDEAGTLSWQTSDYTPQQSWYFVGESNHTVGYNLVNAASHQPLEAAGGAGNRWCVMADETSASTYYFRPFSQKEQEGTALCVEGDSLMQIRLQRSAFARSAQIYDLPCGMTTNRYLAQATVDGTGVLTPLSYPLPVLSGGQVTRPSASAPSTWHTVYTQSAATVVTGCNMDLSFRLNATPAADDRAWVYFDWDRDGIFEEAHELDIAQDMHLTVKVPDMYLVKERTRMRFRLTANTLPDAEDDVEGQTVDFILFLEGAMPDTYPVTVRSNDPARGTAFLLDDPETMPHVAEATPLGNASFICWKEGNRVVSADRRYDFVRDHVIDLVACFSPNTEVMSSVSEGLESESGCIVDIDGKQGILLVKADQNVLQTRVYTPAGALAACANGNRVNVRALPAGTYIVKVVTAGKGASAKVTFK